jgi:hypothetical protein
MDPKAALEIRVPNSAAAVAAEMSSSRTWLVFKPTLASSAVGSRVTMPSGAVAIVGTVTEVPGFAFESLCVAHFKGDAVTAGGGFEPFNKRWQRGIHLVSVVLLGGRCTRGAGRLLALVHRREHGYDIFLHGVVGAPSKIGVGISGDLEVLERSVIHELLSIR